MQISNFDPATFLRDHWQRKPLLVRGAFPAWHNPLDPDELAGLACEDGVEARIVTRRGALWSLERGPFAEDRFASDSRDPWTLLVQAVDHYVADVAAMVQPFRFVPDWRIDDVMVSYASDGGGVGPHFDRYDVFLVQGLGRRRWRLGGHCDATSPLLPHDDLCLLAGFEAEQEYLLEPGDMLYVPPGLAHDGVAVGDDCMTYSIGFRAPARSELVAHWCDHVLEGIAADDLYTDPALQPQAHPGEIDPAALARLQEMVTRELAEPGAFARWFGTYTSTPKYPDTDWRPEEPAGPEMIRHLLEQGSTLARNPASRMAFVRVADGVTLFADGSSFDCPGDLAPLAQAICAGPVVDVPALLMRDKDALALLSTLHDMGVLAFEDED